MFTKKWLPLLCGMAVGLASCTTFQVSGIEIAQETRAENTIGDFDITVRVNQFLGLSSCLKYGNITAHAMDPIISDAISGEIARQGGSRAVNVAIEYRASFLDLFLNTITLRIWSPARLRITGTVVQ